MRRRRLPRVFLTILLFTSAVLMAISMLLLVASVGIKVEPKYLNIPSHAPISVQRKRHRPTIVHPDRPWFMEGGLILPQDRKSKRSRPNLWPHESDSDRIVDQLMYVPQGYYARRNSTALKKILLYFGRNGWSGLPMGRSVFLRDRCPVDTCYLTTDTRESENVDLILFKDRYVASKQTRSPDQVWLLFLLECPHHTQLFSQFAGVFNWTATYRHDSDVVAPYEKFVPYEKPPPPSTSQRNHAEGKTKRVAWFVSNCAAWNHRLQYARELSKHIQVDIYGKCGTHRCPRAHAARCFHLLNRNYKFYLAFENSNCRDYITEKFFVNGLGHDVIPIVMGARPEDYMRSSPHHSYIHVEDFANPRELAQYLHQLDRNDTLYNSYFSWKQTGEFINTRFWCRLCSLLHAPPVAKVYTDLQTWWSGPGTCTRNRWKPSDPGVSTQIP